MKNLVAAVGLVRTLRNWPAYYASQYVRRRDTAGDLTFELRNGMRFRARPGTMDKAVFREVWVREMYVPPGFGLDCARTVVDIGAHVGAFTLFAADRAAHGARLIAFEPDEANFARLDHHVRTNRIRNCQAINAAVAASDGRAPLYRSANNTGGHSLVARPGARVGPVRTLALAPFLEREGIADIDYLKIDCEGSEYDIVFNLPASWFRRIRQIGMEVHAVDASRTSRAMKAFLESRGFAVDLRHGNRAAAMLYARRLA
jgi:FkbM family methyltransferase